MAKPEKARAGQASKEEKSRVGRPRKGRSGIPQVSLIDAIDLVKKAYGQAGDSIKSFSGMADAMGLATATASRSFGELRQYGFMENTSGGWKITDAGVRAAQGDRSVTIDALRTNDILQDLFDNLKDENVSKDYVEAYIKKARYSYNLNTDYIATRYLESIDYINGLNVSRQVEASQMSPSSKSVMADYLRLTQLKYALSPPKEDTISRLAQDVGAALEQNEDIALKTLGSSIREHNGEVVILQVMVDNALKIVSAKNPTILTTDVIKKDKTKKTQNEG